MKDKNKEIALEWLKNESGIKLEDFEPGDDPDDTPTHTRDFYAYEMAQFHDALAPKTPMKQWIKKHYKTETFFEDHERQANRYYGF